MAKAIFIVPIVNNSPQMPPIDSEDDYHLSYVDAQGLRTGGWSCLGNVPVNGTSLVLVNSSDTVIDLMAADSNYQYIEDVV